MADGPDLTNYFRHLGQRLQSDDSREIRVSAIHMCATMSAIGHDSLRERIIITALTAGLLEVPAETFSSELETVIQEILNGN